MQVLVTNISFAMLFSFLIVIIKLDRIIFILFIILLFFLYIFSIVTPLSLYVDILNFQKLFRSCKNHSKFISLDPRRIRSAFDGRHWDFFNKFVLSLKKYNRRVDCGEIERESKLFVSVIFYFRENWAKSVARRKRSQNGFRMIFLFLLLEQNLKTLKIRQIVLSLGQVANHQFAKT